MISMFMRFFILIVETKYFFQETLCRTAFSCTTPGKKDTNINRKENMFIEC